MAVAASPPVVQCSRAAAAEYLRLHGIPAEAAAGLRTLARSTQTGLLVGVYNALEAGIEDDGYVTICESHDALIVHPTRSLAEAHAADPLGWCGECRARHHGHI